jgi:hypothetical protein
MTTPHNWSAFRRQTADHIAREGRSILGVGGGKYGEPPFSYTIGNHFEGLPELLLIGSARTPYLNDLWQLMIARGEPFREGEIVALPMLSLPLKLVCVDDIRAWGTTPCRPESISVMTVTTSCRRCCRIARAGRRQE